MTKFEVEVRIELEAADEDEARRLVDQLLQKAHEQSGGNAQPWRERTRVNDVPWHFTLLDDCVQNLDDRDY